MDIDDKMMVQLFTEEHKSQAVRRQQQKLILTNILRVRQPFFVVPRRGGSKPGKRKNINRHREAGAMLLDADYFNDDATHSPKDFWRWFRMNKDLFLKIVQGVREYHTYFMAKKDCTCLWGFTSIQKCTAAMRCLAYGAPPDTSNDYLRMTESTCTESFYRFCRAVIAVFAKDYLRAPRADDTARILQKNAAIGFLGMLGSIDCMHWDGRIALLFGTNNDINVLQRSPVFARLAEGQDPTVNFEATGRHASRPGPRPVQSNATPDEPGASQLSHRCQPGTIQDQLRDFVDVIQVIMHLSLCFTRCVHRVFITTPSLTEKIGQPLIIIAILDPTASSSSSTAQPEVK
ncbi:hypothetical protein QYE76_057995 [Lolium multiflorum]|uniref:Uncharacterized protein n=1 Tax=Lolium multiflorum TaxID=4521 RepID=A0AAD8WPK5_LOLMU|nr:hypothetical protein QYE76_057995 [Lolium multiflorum]